MTAIMLGLVSAIVWGGSDYSGGRATRRAPALSVTVLSQLLAAPLLVVALVLLPGQLRLVDLVWGAVAGLAGAVGLVAFYAALSGGAMAVAAPLTAVTSAVVPMAIGLALGESPGPVRLGGALCAVTAIALVSAGAGGGGGLVDRSARVRTIGLSLGAGTMFGVFLGLLAQTHHDSGLWPLAAGRAASILLGLVIVAGRLLRGSGGALAVPHTALGLIALAGVGDVAANALFLVATRFGLLSLVAPIASLYPVTTVLLALGLDRERVRPVQLIGLGLAATAVVLTAI